MSTQGAIVYSDMPRRGEDDAWEKYWDHVGNEELKEIWFGYYLELADLMCGPSLAIRPIPSYVPPAPQPRQVLHEPKGRGRGRGRGGKKGGKSGMKGVKGRGNPGYM
eukprot:TRINITY_DN14312_c0_g1_i1.p2 TRINITY_DN14312_c0_g1~~TRINITY_DN14312_c0_g1_i1.p2  ORF type:complete len:107 (+),score=2.71 TRINITY_DN14312_c0_g1_i1:39-359(+)